MSISLTVGNKTYNYPTDGQDPNWAEEASEWAEAVTNVLATLVSAGDILQTTATINNNVAVATNVNGLLFNPTNVRAANVEYSIYRISTANPSGNAESGTLYLIYDTNAGSGSKWTLSQRVNGNAGITFSITDAGQVQYLSTDINATGYSGTMKFAAKTLST